MGARHAASLAVFEPSMVAALVCGGAAPLPSLEGRRERTLDWAESVDNAQKMEASLRGMGSPEEAIVESMARNDAAALSAAIAGIAERAPAAENVRAPSLWYEGSNDRPYNTTAQETLISPRPWTLSHIGGLTT
jgi:pimeloyl-ACP methyl ester carboxylesterase